MKIATSRLVAHLLLFAVCLAVLNPYVAARLDPHPPLTQVEVALVTAVLGVLTFVIVLSFFLGWKVVLVNVVVGLVLLFLLNGAARLFFPEFDHFAFRGESPEPYRNAEYYSQDFLDESFRQPDGWYMQPGTDRVYPNDFEGRWFNVEAGVRRTLFQPADPTQTVYLLGGSTVYNSEVPDAFTVASQLQLLINEVSNAAVVNLGVTSVHSGQQLSRLKADVDLRPGDIVVFFDGVNDVMQRVVYESREGYIIGRPKNEPFQAQLLRKLADELDIVRVAVSLAGQDREFEPKLANDATGQYVSVLDAASAYTENQGAEFFHFLQPTIYTRANHNEYERNLLASMSASNGGSVENAYVLTYPKFQAELATRDYSTDLTGIFDSLDQSPYLDFCHVNHVGNRVIAENIFATIRDELPPRT